MLAMTWKEPAEIASILERMAALTDRPYGVNLILRTEQEERLRRCLDAGARIFSFFWGDPAPLVPIAHDAGALVMHTVGSAAEARRVVDSGVDVVVAQGWEAGGHVWGDVATLALVPAVVDAVGPTTVDRGRRDRRRTGAGGRPDAGRLGRLARDALRDVDRGGRAPSLSGVDGGRDGDVHRPFLLVRHRLGGCAPPHPSEQHLRGMGGGRTPIDRQSTRRGRGHRLGRHG